jgi:hypothetical protein
MMYCGGMDDLSQAHPVSDLVASESLPGARNAR